MHESHITTIEGLATTATQNTHPVAEAFEKLGATQCGYCTPGFIMALVARLEDGDLKTRDLERLFDGNLCRCTGYRPILDAAAVFCVDDSEIDTELGAQAAQWRKAWQDCIRLESLFPDEYKKRPQTASFKGIRTTWFQPVELKDLLPKENSESSLETHSWASPEAFAKLISGNTDVGYSERVQLRTPRNKISLNHVWELLSLEWKDDRLEIGAGIAIRDLVNELEERIVLMPESQSSGLKALHNQCRFFANNQIRNVATVGGGVINFSHYSDLLPVWIATRATLHFWSPSGSESVRLIDQYDPKVAANDIGGALRFKPRAKAVLVSISVPFSEPDERVASFKYARRRMDSITFMSAAVSARHDVASHAIKSIVLCFDGLGTPGLRAMRTEALLSDKVWDNEVLSVALISLKEELETSINNGLPKELQEYQIRLAQGALLRFYARYRERFHGDIEKREEQLLSRYPSIAHRSQLNYGQNNTGVLGAALPHINSRLQTTGEAKYSVDYRVPNCLHACIVTSPVAHGRLKSIKAGKASHSPDFVGLYTARDIPGKNLFGFRVEDEEVLASQTLQYAGQPVAVLVARTEAAARALVHWVQVEVEEDAALLSIGDAEAAGSTHGKADGYLLEQGNLQEGLQTSYKVISGSVHMHGQQHFYLEPQNAVAVPKDDGFEIYSSTQSPSNVVDHVASLLGISDNRIRVQVGRLGGGFGGKQFRAGPIAGICALAAHHAKAPVKLTLQRPEDMAYCPGRSPFYATYKAGFGEDGTLCALDVDFKVNGGCSNDYSADITETATLRTHPHEASANHRHRASLRPLSTMVPVPSVWTQPRFEPRTYIGKATTPSQR
jgi:xanthine dehydrogenase/oxidase